MTINAILERIEEYREGLANKVQAFKETENFDKRKEIIRQMPFYANQILNQIHYLDNAVEQTLLKPCPFCHGAAELYTCDGGDYGDDYPEIECLECGCSMTFDPGTTKEEAIKIWNTRK